MKLQEMKENLRQISEGQFASRRKDRKNYTVQDELIDLKNALKIGLKTAATFTINKYDGYVQLLDMNAKALIGAGNRYYIGTKQHIDRVIDHLENKYGLSMIPYEKSMNEGKDQKIEFIRENIYLLNEVELQRIVDMIDKKMMQD